MKIFRMLAGLGLLLTAISAYGSVKTDYDRDFDLRKLKTFTFSVQNRSSKDPLGTDTVLSNRIENALRRQLEAQGFQYAADGNADFNVSYFASSKERLNIEDFGYGMPRRWRWGFGPNLWTSYYTVGSVVVDFVDPSSQQLIWRGVATETVSGVNPSDKQVNKGAEDLAKHFLKDAKKERRA